MLTIALLSAKAGTGKTTSAVWLAHAFVSAGRNVLLVDADPQGSALEWEDLLDDRFPFRTAGLRDPQRVPDFARPDDVVVIDCPQLEDHPKIGRAAMRVADEIVIPCAPTTVEIARTAPMRAEIDAMAPVRLAPLRSCVLLNRTIMRANSTTAAREALEGLGYDVLRTPVPRLEMFAQSYGAPVLTIGMDIWRNVATDLLHRAEIEELAR
jgi:chromosome partitioning protein